MANPIRRATPSDAGRIAEIQVFNNRLNFFPIFGDEDYSFNYLQVESFAQGLRESDVALARYWVYDDGVIRACMQVDQSTHELEKLHVDPCFQGCGIGSDLLRYAVEQLGVRELWVLEKNDRGRHFYEGHGFAWNSSWKYEEDTTERLLRYVLSF